MYFPSPRVEYSVADTSRFDVLVNGSVAGIIDITQEFKYLGSIIHSSLTSEADVDRRIKSATAAFGALKNIFTNRNIDLKIKGRIYTALCLSILLYGSEVWCLKEDLFHRLRSFHRCARTMCRISIAYTIRHHISSESLFGRLDIESLDTYYHRRLLRWAGHIARMPLNRAPRMFLTGWVANSRPTGCPQMTWGRTLKKALQRNSLPTDFSKWRELAADRGQWRAICGAKSKEQQLTETSQQSTWTRLRNGNGHF